MLSFGTRLIALTVVSALAGCAGPRSKHADTSGVDRAVPDTVRAILIERSDLFDPFSAQFRRLAYEQASYGVERWCGQINVKNRQGGYVGWYAFSLARLDTAIAFVLEADDASTDKLLLADCAPLAPAAVVEVHTRDSIRTDEAEREAQAERELNARLLAEERRVEEERRRLCAAAPSASSKEQAVCACLAAGQREHEAMKACLVHCFRWSADDAAMYWGFAPRGCGPR